MFYGHIKGRGYLSLFITSSTWVGWGLGDNGTSWKYHYKLVCKRDRNDVDGECTFKEKGDLLAYVEDLKVNLNIPEKDRLSLCKVEVKEHDSVPIKKRLLVSRLTHKFKELKISKAKGDCCGTCGWTISYDEPYLQFQGLQICIHCMKELYDISKPHLEKMDEGYHNTWLLERVTREI